MPNPLIMQADQFSALAVSPSPYTKQAGQAQQAPQAAAPVSYPGDTATFQTQPKKSSTAWFVTKCVIAIAAIGGALAATRKWAPGFNAADMPLKGFSQTEGTWAKIKYPIAKAGEWIIDTSKWAWGGVKNLFGGAKSASDNAAKTTDDTAKTVTETATNANKNA